MNKELVTCEEREKAIEYERQNALRLARFFTGIAGTKRTDWGTSIGHAFQGLIEGRFLQTLSDEVTFYEEKGRINKDFRSSDASQMCFAELLKFLEQDIPDPQRLEILKKIYIVAATEGKSDRNSPLPLQFMQIARNLSAGELLVLFSAYRQRNDRVNSYSECVETLVEESGLKFNVIVHQYIDQLRAKRLLRPKEECVNGIEQLGKIIQPFGLAFCDYVEYYDLFEENPENK